MVISVLSILCVLLPVVSERMPSDEFTDIEQKRLDFVTMETRGDALISKVGNFPEPVINIGRGRALNESPYKAKITLLQEFLADWPNENLVVFMDGDSFWGGCSRRAFLKAYENIVKMSGSSIVFSAEVTCWELDCRIVPAIPSYANVKASQWQPYVPSECGPFDDACSAARRCDHCSDPPTAKFLNSGFLMGPAGELKKMVNWASKEYDRVTTLGDQSVYAAYWLSHTSEVTLDYETKLSLMLSRLKDNVVQIDPQGGTVRNKPFGHTQCMIHAGGRAKQSGYHLFEDLRAALKAKDHIDPAKGSSSILENSSSSDAWEALYILNELRTPSRAKDLWFS